MAQSGRLLSLDVMRGITIAGMIMVNNPGTWEYVYAPLQACILERPHSYRSGLSVLYVHHGSFDVLFIAEI